jgi:hypothetical protein
VSHRLCPNRLFAPVVVAVIVAFAVPVIAADIPDSPDGTVRFVMEQLAERHPEVVWQALPPTYQKDITELTHTFAAKMDPEVWSAAFALGSRTAALLRDKKDIILASSFADMAGEERDSVADGWDAGVAFLDSFCSSDVARLDALQSIDWGNYLATTGRDLMNSAAERSKANGKDTFDQEITKKLEQATIELVSRDGDSATVKVSAPDEDPEDIELTRVEGRWVPSDMADDWDSNVAEAKQKLAALSDEEIEQSSMQTMMFIGMLDGVLAELETVETTEEFEQAIQGILGPFLEGMAGEIEEGFEEAGEAGDEGAAASDG